jgi:hypothetical protein
MSVNDAQVQALVISKVGDIDPTTLAPTTSGTGLLAVNVPVLWSYYLDKAVIAPRLQALYTERDAIKLVLARLRMLVDFNTGQALAMKQSQKTAALQAMLTETEGEISTLERQTSASHRAGGATGALTRTTPIPPPISAPETPYEAPSPYLDPSDPRYSGSPYFPQREPW